MTEKKRYLPIAAIAAVALVAAACSSSGDGPTTPPPPPDPKLTALEAATALAARMDNIDADVAMLLDNAIESAGMLSTKLVDGDSAMAADNADMVLKAKIAINDALTAADTAIMEANALNTAAEDIENAIEKAAVMRILDYAIESVDELKKTAQAIIDAADSDDDTINTLGEAVAAVEGGDEDMPKTAADAGLAVAAEMLAALRGPPGNETADQLKVVVGTVPSLATKNVVYKDNHKGKTWVELVGADKIVDTRIVVGNVTAAVKATSVAGMTFDSTETATGEDNFTPDGTQIAQIAYKGIEGTIFCQGADCRVEVDTATEEDGDRKFVGSWYFTATNSASGRIYYVANPASEGNYIMETVFAQYGYWLSFEGNVPVVNRFATSAATANEGAWSMVGDETNMLGATATYTGPAVGVSAMKDSEGMATGSGAFTAKATLSASFGDSSTLGGSITEFQGDAANLGWIVTLPAVAFDGSILGAMTAIGSGPGGAGAAGKWSATSYGGSATARPAGIFGGFDAHFIDGDAAGVYNTVK